MKKSLLALAVMSAIAGSAQAQSSVTIYGVLDMAINNENNGLGGAGTKTALDSGIQSGSRLGFKGSEDLGGGLKAIFQLEMGVNADAGKSAQGGIAFGRGAWVGLAGDFGSVKFGRQNKPLHIAVDSIDPFETGLIGGTAGDSTSATGLGNLFYQSNPRSDNTINYTTNDMGGFSGTVAYTMGEQAGDTGKLSQIGLSGSYNAGPLSAVLAYNTEKDKASISLRHTFLGASYNFGPAKLHGAYGKVTADAGYSPNGKTDFKLWMLGATVPVSAVGNVITSYTATDFGGTATKSNQLALGYTHGLSKRTNLYTSVSRVSNDANVAQLANKNGATERLVNVGIRHMF